MFTVELYDSWIEYLAEYAENQPVCAAKVYETAELATDWMRTKSSAASYKAVLQKKYECADLPEYEQMYEDFLYVFDENLKNFS